MRGRFFVPFQTTKKSALLTAAKKAKLRSRPSRVRFAEGVVINGSPLYSSDLEGSPIPNVMKVFLENGHTKSFKYDNSTSVASVLDVLKEKVSRHYHWKFKELFFVCYLNYVCNPV